MNKSTELVVIGILLALLGVFFGVPWLIRVYGPPALGTGSIEHARLWRDKLATCNSLDDVRKEFNCGSWQYTPEGSCTYVRDPNTYKEGNTWALLYDLPNGDWCAMAYGSSHNTWGGGTVVTRDDTGAIRVFFGHVCGKPFNEGNSLEELYADFNDANWEEIILED